MKLKIIFTLIIIFTFTTSANTIKKEDLSKTEIFDFDRELIEIKLELQEADKRNKQLEIATRTNKQLRDIKRIIKQNK